MKNQFSQHSIVSLSLMAAALSLSATLAHATANYDAFAEASLTIDSIINQTNQANPADLSGLSITRDDYPPIDPNNPPSFFYTTEGKTEIGNAQASYNGTTILQDSSSSSPGWLFQSSDAHGTADASSGLSIADSIHGSTGWFDLRNESPTDSFQINFSLVYNLAVNASVTNPASETAVAEAYVRLIDSLLQAELDKTLNANAQGILAPTDESWGDTLLFSISLAPGDFDKLSLTISASGRADPEPLPEPATFFLIGAGLLGLIAPGRRNLDSVAG